MWDARCKKCRYFGEKLFLKGEKCFTPKCPLVRKGAKVSRGRYSGYKKQLIEKQKVKLIYGIRERQLKRYFEEALRKEVATPQALGQILELRMDNVVFRLGFAPSRSVARQLISHGHFLLNGKPHNISSTILKVGDIVSIKPNSLKKKIFQDLTERIKKINVPKYLHLDLKNIEGKVVSVPDIEEMRMPFDLRLVVEFYSR